MTTDIIKQFILSLLILLAFTSCITTKESDQKIITKWYEKNITFPYLMNSYQQDSLLLTMLYNEFKILTFVDSNECTECHLQLYKWKKLIQETDSLFNNVSFLFIIFPQKGHTIELLKKKNKFDYPTFYDNNGNLWKANDLPKTSKHQTFLLNSENQVLLIGNPINNPRLWNLYKQTISKKINEI